MIKTEYFLQLSPTPLWRIRNQYRRCERKHLPISLNFLVDNGVDPARVQALFALAGHDRVTEMMLVSVIFLCLFEGEPLTARSGIDAWMRRKGGCPQTIEMAAKAFAREILDSEENVNPEIRVRERVIREQSQAFAHQSLLTSVNDRRLLVEEPFCVRG